MEQAQRDKLVRLTQKVRRDVLLMLEHVGSGHLGGSMSIVELLAVLYGKRMRHRPNEPRWSGRDRVVLSKGHAGPAWYATLAECGYFDRAQLMTLNDPHTMLPSHPDRTKTPGVDMTTGSLGQGCSTAAGIATALRLQKSDNRVYLIVGDGELNEGQCWEAFQYLAHHKLSNCVVIIDWNKRQLDGALEDVITPFDIAAKMRSFGFAVEQVNGQNLDELDEALSRAEGVENQATCIVMDTVKGAGIPFFETYAGNHSVKFSDPAVKAASDEAVAGFEAALAKSESSAQGGEA